MALSMIKGFLVFSFFALTSIPGLAALPPEALEGYCDFTTDSSRYFYKDARVSPTFWDNGRREVRPICSFYYSKDTDACRVGAGLVATGLPLTEVFEHCRFTLESGIETLIIELRQIGIVNISSNQIRDLIDNASRLTGLCASSAVLYYNNCMAD